MKHKLQYQSIQFKMLFWVTLSFMIPFLGIAVFWNDYLTKNLIHNRSIENEQHLQQAAISVTEDLYASPKSLLGYIESDPILVNIQSGNLKNYLENTAAASLPNSEAETQLSTLFSRVRGNFKNVNFIYLGLDDGSYIEYPPFRPKKTYDPRLRPWYVNAYPIDGIFTSDAYFTSETNEMVISFSKKIQFSSGKTGVLGITMNINQIADQLKTISLGTNGKIMLLNHQNQILASPLNAEWILKKPESVGQGNLLIQNKANFQPYHYQQDYYKQIYIEPKSDLKFIAFYPKSEVLALSKTLILTTSILILLLWLMVVLLSSFILKRFTTPLIALVNLIQKSDDPSYKYTGELSSITHRSDEIGLITKVVLDLILTLRQIVDYTDDSKIQPQSNLNLIASSVEPDPLNNLSRIALENSALDRNEKESAKKLYLQSRRALLASENRLQKAFDLLNDGLWEYQTVDGSLYFNEKLKNLSGMTEEKPLLALENLYALIEPISKEQYKQGIIALISGDESYYEIELCLNDGTDSHRWHLAKIRSIHESNQNLLLIGTFSDIHESKVAEESLKNMNAILEEKINERTQDLLAMNEELTAMNEEVLDTNKALKETQDHLIQTEKLASLGILVAGVAHEINTPLGNAITASSYLHKLYVDLEMAYGKGSLTKSNFQNYLNEIREALSLLESNLDRSADLILTFRSIAGDNSSEQPRLFYLEEVVEEVLVALKPRLKLTPHHFSVEIDEALSVRAYPSEFAQILTNLVLNSFIHGYDNTKPLNIRIRAAKEDATLYFHYSDDGRGMSDDIRQKAFDPFFTTDRTSGGTGLGLYFVHNIVTTHFNGIIRCETAPNAGTNFLISFNDLFENDLID